MGFDPSKAVTTPIVPACGNTCGVAVTGGFVQAGNGNLPGFPKVNDGLVNPNYKNFGPRVGFASLSGHAARPANCIRYSRTADRAVLCTRRGMRHSRESSTISWPSNT